MEFLIFSINGGAGKNIAATAVIKAIKKANPDINIIILTAFKEVWLYNPNIYRVYIFGQPSYFYNDFIKDKKVKIFCIDPYLTEDYILKRKHLIEIWCDICGVKFDNETPELFFNQREIEFVKNFYIQDKKLFVIQTNGGFPQDLKISWMRDLPISVAQPIVDKMFQQGFAPIHIRRDDQPALNRTEQFKGSLREMFLLIRFSEKRLFMDSVAQHAAAAVGAHSTVTWVRNSPEILGYSSHHNIVTSAHDELDVFSNSVLEPYDITGNLYQCPFKEGTELFDTEIILTSLENQKNKITLIT